MRSTPNRAIDWCELMQRCYFDEEITIYKNHFFTGYAGAPVLKNKATMHVQQVTSSHCSRILGGHYSVVRYNLVDQQRTRETSG